MVQIYHPGKSLLLRVIVNHCYRILSLMLTNHEGWALTHSLNYSLTHLFIQSRVISEFTDVSSRKGFIRKVYGIFMVQMAATISATAYTMNNSELQNFFFQHIKPLFTAAFSGIFLSSMALQWAPNLRYKAPANFILLGIHTLCNSFFLAIFSTMFDPKMVCLGIDSLAYSLTHSLNYLLTHL